MSTTTPPGSQPPDAALPVAPVVATHAATESLESTRSVDVDLSSTAPVAPPQRLGPYQLLEKLGAGGMGTVYKARQTKLNKTVAIKLLPPERTRSDAARARFEREMLAVGGLDHPHIVRALDADEFEGTHYLVMEFVPGQDLQRLVREYGPLAVGDACRMIQQVADGLAYAHAQGLVHRDIKPANLMLVGAAPATGTVKILDLGLARLNEEEAGGLTNTGQVMGTPDYMAPEQWEDTRAVDARTDLYALGCTLFFLLAGRPPFGTEEFRSLPRKMNAHICAAIPDLSAAARETLPPGVIAIYQRLLSKNPADRFASAAELSALLAPFVHRTHEPPAYVGPDPTSAADAFASTTTITIDPSRAAGASPSVAARSPTKRAALIAGGMLAIVMVAYLLIKMANQSRSVAQIQVPDGGTIDPLRANSAGELLAPLEIDYAAERRVAERLLKLKKGQVWLSNDQRTWELSEPLPSEPFFVSSATLAVLDVTDKDLALLAGCRGLNELRLHYSSQITAAGLKAAGRLPRLETLNLAGTSCARDSLAFLVNYPRLKWLSLAGDGRVGIMKTLPACPRLTHLETPQSNGSVGDEGMQMIARQCPELTQLMLLDAQEHSLSPLARLRKLQELICWGRHLNAAAVTTLAELPDFAVLRVESPDPVCLRRLAPLREKLREFEMRDQGGNGPPSLTDSALWLPITQCPNLERLTIHTGIAVDSAAWRTLATLPKLKSFRIDGDMSGDQRSEFRNFTDADIAAFRKARPDVELQIDNKDYPAATGTAD